MKISFRLSCLTLSVSLLTFSAWNATQASGQTSSQASAQKNLAKILDQLDQSSRKFKTAQAQFKWDNYERIVRDTTTQTGWIYFDRAGGTIEMGAKVDPPDATPTASVEKATPKGARVLQYKDGDLQMFDPAQNQIDLIKAGKNKAQYESFLTLGFGGSGADLKKAWNVEDQGPEAIDGVTTEKLDLKYKTPTTDDLFTHITIWVDPTRAVLLKQVFYKSDGDYRTSYYTHITVNQSIDTAAYVIAKNKNTKTLVH